MIIKSADDKEASIRTLEAILKIPGLPANKRALVDQEIRTTKSGIKGESDAAYLIDSHFNDSDNTMVLHDLRLELADGRVAQIDHLLIHRTGRMWVLESKRVAHGIKITDDGEFLRWNGRQYDGMASPLEQNKRHVEVVKALIRSLDGRFEIKQYLAYVLLSSKARIDRPKKFDASLVVKADLFISAYERDLEKIGLFSLLGAIFTGEHVALARELARQHKPIEFDYGSRFGVSPDAIERMLNPASPQAFQPLANDVRVPRSAPSASSPAAARLPATSPGAVASGPGIGPTAAERPPPPLEQATVATGEWDYDPDWLDHLGLIGQTVGAKLPTLGVRRI